MRANQVRTGDTVLPPSASTESVIQCVRTYRDSIHFVYTRGRAELAPTTPVRIYRKTRTVNHDKPETVYRSEG